MAALTVLLLPAFAAPPPVSTYLTKHCFGCHRGATRQGNLDLAELLVGGTDIAAYKTWVKVVDRVSAGEMPPPGAVPPSATDTRGFLSALGGELKVQHAASKGRALRRLNRREYQNTIDDLLGVHVDVVSLLPEDGRAHGFDTVAEALSISGVQMQRYMEAAEAALNAALQPDVRPRTVSETFTLESERNREHLGVQWLKRPDGSIVVFNDGGYPSTQIPGFRASAPGLHRVRISGYGYQIDEPVAFSVIAGTFNRGGDQEIRGFYELPPNKPSVVELSVLLRAGDGLKIGPVGLNGPDGHSPIRDGPDKYPGEGLAILSVEVEGPIYPEWPPRGQQLLLANSRLREVLPANPALRKRFDYKPTFTADSADPAADSRRAMRQFLEGAFRRPVSSADAAPYLALFDREFGESKDYLIAIRTAAIAALCSPEFLFLKESRGALDDYALASRLSYFLTRSAPDAELLQLASTRTLNRPDVLRTQTERLLQAPGVDRFIADFTDGWLNLRDLEFTTPDRLLYPEFDELLLDSMRRETRGFVRELISGNLSLSNLIQSDFAILNSRLARHYGIAGVAGLEMRKVSLPHGSKRGGLLTQASILKVSANGTTTSPVMRGVWVMDRLLGSPPPPPPPGVPGVEPDIRGAQTLREILAKHRNNETCNSCHRGIDPPGFALESYDVIGGWRERYRSLGMGEQVRLKVEGRNVRYRLGPRVDPSGELPGGKAFQDFAGLRKLLLAEQERVTRSVTEKLLIFAIGREMGFSDRDELARITVEAKGKGHGMKDLMHLVVQSELFRSK